MDRLSFEKYTRQRRINKKHFQRRLCSKNVKKYGVRRVKKGSVIRDIVVFAPYIIDLYKANNHKKFNAFISDIENAALRVSSSKRSLKISFRDTRAITASACLLLIARVDVIINKFKTLKFKLARPHNHPTPGPKKPINLVDAVLCQVGFYELIGKKISSVDINNPSVKCWKFASSEESDGSIAGPILKNIEDENISQSILYRSCIEAISNAAEHAYSTEISIKKTFSLKKWWIFVGSINKEYVVIVCDVGHGIPNTLELTQKTSLLNKIWEKIGSPNLGTHGDCEYIKASTLVKETRTGLSHRGKGTTDLRTFVDKTDNSKMIIFSNRGTYRYFNQKCKRLSNAYDNSSSIGGTIVEWSVPSTSC
ncbi:TPA: hypothetical protein ACNV64_004095 [Aeromonas salmonicida subsp. pectinolytica]|uniref:hypothetical protein n=1 Tax=Aeromonas salmonicida TaxID=645 RepID=UPI00232F90A1|nr:hypothetical protein [Aeromonas salmonicida]WCH28597.1 hypothetical protein ONZ66_07315 [Aeromonas salmonicida]